jgi:hypothetical protein
VKDYATATYWQSVQDNGVAYWRGLHQRKNRVGADQLNGDHSKEDWVPFWNGVLHIQPGAIEHPLHDERLAKFGEHKKALLSKILVGVPRGERSEQLQRNAWSDIERLAFAFLEIATANREAMSVAERKRRLQQLAQALIHARVCIEETMQSPELADGLIRSCWLGTEEYAEAGGRFVDLLHIENRFLEVQAAISILDFRSERRAS